MSARGSLGSWSVRRDGNDLVATSPSGVIKLRGRDEAELNARRSETYRNDLAALRQALADFTPGGYRRSDIPPPP